MSRPYKPAANRRPSPPVGPILHVGLRRVNQLVVVIETAVAATMLIAVVVIVLQQVVMRYFFLQPNPWSEELSRLCFIWLSMLGASLAMEKNTHFFFDELVRRLTPACCQRVRYAVTALVAVILFTIMLLGVGLAILVRAERSPALNLPIAWMYAALPVVAGLMLLHLVAGIRRPLEDTR
jgi:TRAP-type C4-dicarboxylate transport system permease small subunit